MTLPDDTVTVLQQWRAHRDPEAAKIILDRFANMVYGTCLRVLANVDDAEDVTQECFTELFESPPPEIRNLGAWLHTLATHRSYNRLRSEGRRERRERAYGAQAPAHSEVSVDDLLPIVDKAIEDLPEPLREPLVRHFLQGETHRDIASVLEVSRSTITRRIGEAIERLRAELAKQGIVATPALLATLLSDNLAQAAPNVFIAALHSSVVTGVGDAAVHGGATGGRTMLPGLATGTKVAAVAVLITLGIIVSFTMQDVLSKNSSPSASVPVSPGPAVGIGEDLSSASEEPDTEPPLETSADEQTELAQATDTPAEPSNIGGLVLKENGEPIAGATVALRLDSQGDEDPGTFSSTVKILTEGSGRYDFVDLPEAAYTITVTHPDYAPGEYSGIPAGMDDLNIVLIPSKGSVSGTVIKAVEHTPPEEYEVLLLREYHGDLNVTYGALDLIRRGTYQLRDEKGASTYPQNPDAQFNQMRIFAESGGAFMFDAVEPGTYSVVAHAQGYAPALIETIEVTAGERTEGVLLELPAQAVIEGVVINREGAPLSDATVYAGRTPRNWDSYQPKSVITGEDGYYKLDSLADTLRIISVVHKSYTPTLVPLRFDNNERYALLNVMLEPGGAIEGFVLMGDEPIPRVSIDCDAPAPDPANYKSYTDSEGHFRFSGLAPGQWYLLGHSTNSPGSPGFRHLVVEVDVVEGETTYKDVVYPIPTSSLTGTVSINAELAGSGKVRARVIREDQYEDFNVRINGDGIFTLSELYSGTIELTINARQIKVGGVSDMATFDLADGQHLKMDFPLSQGTTLTGTITGLVKGAVNGVAVLRGVHTPSRPLSVAEFNRIRSTNLLRNVFVTPGDKKEVTYTITGIQPGEYTVTAYSWDTRDAQSHRPIPYDAVVITVANEGEISIDLAVR